MIKRVNSTGRRRIATNRVAIEVQGGEPRTFDASIDLQGFEAPLDAEVILEATCAGSNTILRFPWGTVGRMSPCADRRLRDLYGQNVFFSLKVVDRSGTYGRLLGLAENIRPLKGGAKTATGRRGILPVESVELGDEVWKLAFHTDNVFLLVNQRIPGLAERVRFDAAIYSLIYPAILREVLSRALDETGDDDEDSERWPSLWLSFARRLHPENAAHPDKDGDERDEWIDDVVAAFSREHALRDRFVQAAGCDESWEVMP